MSARLVWTERALDDLRKLDAQTRDRVLLAVERLAETGHGDVRRLEGPALEWRLRVGDRRVRFTHVPDQQTILVLRVLLKPNDRPSRLTRPPRSLGPRSLGNPAASVEGGLPSGTPSGTSRRRCHSGCRSARRKRLLTLPTRSSCREWSRHAMIDRTAGLRLLPFSCSCKPKRPGNIEGAFMETRERIHQLVDELPETDLDEVASLLESRR